MRPMQQRRLTIRADVGDSKNMKGESKQAQAPEQGCGTCQVLYSMHNRTCQT